MRKWIKRAGLATGGLIGAGALLLAAAGYLAGVKADRKVDVRVAAVALDTSTATLEKGRYMFNSRGCAHCHGDNGTGREVINADGMLVVAPNITGGANGVTAGYTTVDWVRTLRHGVKPDGRPIRIMPSDEYTRFTDSDIGAIISFAKSLAPMPGASTVIQFPLPVKVLYAVGVIKDAEEKIDHATPPASAAPDDVSVAHGAYLASMCMGCHGARLSGGAVPGGPPSWPAAANLTSGPGSVLSRYPTVESFVAMMRGGRRPDGSAVSDAMPFPSLKQLDDQDLKSLYLYLHSVPAVAAGSH
jgi:mono/diheme cytochrome c family protein